MYVSNSITDQLKAATTRKQCLEIILEECFLTALTAARKAADLLVPQNHDTPD